MRRYASMPNRLTYRLLIAAMLIGILGPSLTVRPLRAATRAPAISPPPQSSAASPAVVSGSLTVGALQDTWINASSAAQNYGACDQTTIDMVGGWLGNGRALYQFELPRNIPTNATITSATMQLSKVGGSASSRVVEVYAITAPWDEGAGGCAGAAGSANWTQRQGGVNWAANGGDVAPAMADAIAVKDPGPYQWDITPEAQGWIATPTSNHGVLAGVIDLSSNTYHFASREHADSNLHPKLTIEHNGGAIDGVVWMDTNADTVIDGDETRFAAINVELFGGACGDPAAPVLATTVTDGNGAYDFAIVPAGDYCVAIDRDALPADLIVTTAGNTIDVNMDASEEKRGQNFGYASIYAEDRLSVGLNTCGDVSGLVATVTDHGGQIINSQFDTCTFLVEVSPENQTTLRNALQGDANVAFANRDIRSRGGFVPNDPDYGNTSLVFAPQQINAPTAWDHTLGDPNLIIAILDTGIDASHAEFAGRLLAGYDYVNEDGDPADDHGHGTHVAGIAAAGIDDGIGMPGIAGDVKILPMKVLNNNNLGWWSDVSQAIMDAADQGAKVISISITGNSGSSALVNAIQYANSKGALIVVAAGNDGVDAPKFPASYAEPNLLSVGATGYSGARWTLSNYGPNVEIMAPGQFIHAPYWQAGGSNAYTFLTGTSMATPHVAGVAALMFSVAPQLTPQEVIQQLNATATDLGDPGVDAFNGHGLVNAGAAVEAVSVPPPPTTVTVVKAVDKPTAMPGEILEYTISVAFAGDPALLNGAQVSDAVPAGATYVPGSANAGGSENSGVVSWTLNGIAPATLTYQVTINNPAGGNISAAPATFNDPNGVIDPANSNSVQTSVDSAINGRIWADVDGDTIQDPSESGVAGVTVKLTDPLNRTFTATTASDGRYTFSGLDAGPHTVDLDATTLPPEYTLFTTIHPVNVMLAGGAEIDYIAIGVRGLTAAVGDFIWYDADADGVQDVGEHGWGNVTVELYYDDDGDGDFNPTYDYRVDATVSSPSGAYILHGPISGDYFVVITDDYSILDEFSHSVGVQSMASPTSLLTLQSGSTLRDADFGYVRVLDPGQAVVTGHVWLDGDGSGVYDTVEPILLGVPVCATPTGDGNPVCVDTDLNGHYLLALAAGSYDIAPQAPPPGMMATTTVPAQEILADGDQRLGLNFGYQPLTDDTASLGGEIWQDIAIDDVVNGIYDRATEPGINSVTVHVIQDLNQDGQFTEGEPILASTCDCGGAYLFDSLLPGDYLVEITDSLRILSTFAPTVLGPDPHADDNNHAIPYAIHLFAGDSKQTVDFGYREYEATGAGDTLDPGIIGHHVWLDLNDNGLYDADGDTPIPGVTLALHHNGEIVQRTTTGADGAYLFIDLGFGDYSVEITDDFGVLTGLAPTRDAADPSASGASKRSPHATSLNFANVVDHSANFGFVPAGVEPGNCNADNEGVNAGDISALTLEIFDGDGVMARDAAGGTFAGDSIGCDANIDEMINAGDISCTTLTIFNGQGACAVIAQNSQRMAATLDSPLEIASTITQTIPSQVPATADGMATVPITISNVANNLTTIGFSVNFDQALLTLDPTDDNPPASVPDAITLNLPAGWFPNVVYPTATPGQIGFLFLSFGSTWPIGVTNPVIISFGAGSPASVTETPVTFSDASTGTSSGQGGPTPDLNDGSVLISPLSDAQIDGTVCVWNSNPTTDGLCEAGEAPLSSVTIDLVYAGADGGIGTGGDDITTTKTTNASGIYSFTSLLAGNYRIIETDPPGYISHADADGDDPNQIDVTLSASQVQGTRDFEDMLAPTASYAITKTLNTASPLRTGERVTFTIRIRNTGDMDLTTIPLQDDYQEQYMTYVGANYAPDNSDNDGTINWADLTVSTGQPLPSDQFIDLIVEFTSKLDTTTLPDSETVNTATGVGVVAGGAQTLPNLSASAGVQIFNPTAALIVERTVSVQDGVAILHWVTADESQLLAFNIYRSIAGGEWTLVTPQAIVAAHAGQSQGTIYSYQDTLPTGAATARYELEALLRDGSSTRLEMRGMRAGGRIYLPVVSNQ